MYILNSTHSDEVLNSQYAKQGHVHRFHTSGLRGCSDSLQSAINAICAIVPR